MQTFAVIPAAGRSRRMGQPKLLLPWGASTVIEHVLAAWSASRVDHVVVVVDPADRELARRCAACGVEVVVPDEAPAEMKDSVMLGLRWAEHYQPDARDAWLVAPADMPGLKSEIINLLVDAHGAALARGEKPCIRAARYSGRRGHPVLFPWPLAAEVARLGPDEGLDALVARRGLEHLDVPAGQIPEDFDTPEEYARLRARFES
jgi:molybdenum cofactor cytidylyltransferase